MFFEVLGISSILIATLLFSVAPTNVSLRGACHWKKQ
jgi:hypothetical protein